MKTFKLKRGKGEIVLSPRSDLIAVKSSSGSQISDLDKIGNDMITQKTSDKRIGEFQIIKSEKPEQAIEAIQRLTNLEDSSLVYKTPYDETLFIPTGEIFLKFSSISTEEKKLEILKEYHLIVVDSIERQTNNHTKETTHIVKTTTMSPPTLEVTEQLQALQIVDMAEADLLTESALYNNIPITDQHLDRQWHLQNKGGKLGLKEGADARVVQAWKETACIGSPNCTIAIIDDGFDLKHPDLSGNWKIVAPYDFSSNTSDPGPKLFDTDTSKADYHGTAVAGVAVGNANEKGIVGVAPKCSLMPLRWRKYFADTEISSWFRYAMQMGAHVINCSWGPASNYYPLNPFLGDAIKDCAHLGRNGLGSVIVFAAGNNGVDVNDQENGFLNGFAEHPDTIAVAACNSLDERSTYSNFGKEISVCAPSSGAGGREVFTSDVTGVFYVDGNPFPKGYNRGPYTNNFGGTSSAAPIVSGVCGLILSLNPTLTAEEVKLILERTARKIGNEASYDKDGHSIHFGYGCVNARAALGETLLSLKPPY